MAGTFIQVVEGDSLYGIPHVTKQNSFHRPERPFQIGPFVTHMSLYSVPGPSILVEKQAVSFCGRIPNATPVEMTEPLMDGLKLHGLTETFSSSYLHADYVYKLWNISRFAVYAMSVLLL